MEASKCELLQIYFWCLIAHKTFLSLCTVIKANSVRTWDLAYVRFRFVPIPTEVFFHDIKICPVSQFYIKVLISCTSSRTGEFSEAQFI